MQLDKSLLDAVGVTSERLFGYLYAGTLTTIAAWLIKPTPIERLLQSSGSIVAMLIVIAVGSGVFGVYFRILGGIILFPVTHWLHRLWDRIRRRTLITTVTSTIWYLDFLGAKDPEEAYLEVKDSFAPARSSVPLGEGATATEVRFFHAHGEVHFFYLTSIVTFACGIFVAFVHTMPGLPWFVVAGVSYVVAVVADIRLHSSETQQMRNCQTELRDFLRDKRLLSIG